MDRKTATILTAVTAAICGVRGWRAFASEVFLRLPEQHPVQKLMFLAAAIPVRR